MFTEANSSFTAELSEGGFSSILFADGSNPIVIDGELVESPTKVQDGDAVQKDVSSGSIDDLDDHFVSSHQQEENSTTNKKRKYDPVAYRKRMMTETEDHRTRRRTKYRDYYSQYKNRKNGTKCKTRLKFEEIEVSKEEKEQNFGKKEETDKKNGPKCSKKNRLWSETELQRQARLKYYRDYRERRRRMMDPDELERLTERRREEGRMRYQRKKEQMELKKWGLREAVVVLERIDVSKYLQGNKATVPSNQNIVSLLE